MPLAPADVIVIGAGPAGLMAAIAAAEAGAAVTLVEHLPRVGAKLLVTGGGRCNLTNTLPATEFMARFGRCGRFLGPALARLSSDRLRTLLDQWGVPTRAADAFHVFPCSEKAADVQQALWQQAVARGVELRLGTKALDVLVECGAVTGVRVDSGTLPGRAVVVATGGLSYPKLGARGWGFGLAQRLGHRVARPVPALVPLLVREAWVGGCAGVVLPRVRTWLEAAETRRAASTEGAVLFTHAGVSGPAILDLSGQVATALDSGGEATVRVCLCPGVSLQAWRERVDGWRREQGAKLIRTLLDQHFPVSLAAVLADLAGVPDCRAARLTRAAGEQLVAHATALRLTVTGTEGFARAMVTRGGVALAGLDPHTLSSRLVQGLHFAGEVVDLDGPCGGFNLQWAFSSGCLAGGAAAESGCGRRRS